MGLLKRRLAVLLVFCMVLTGTVPVFADALPDRRAAAEISAQTVDPAAAENDGYKNASPSNVSYEESVLPGEEGTGEAIPESIALNDETEPEEASPSEAKRKEEFFGKAQAGNVIITVRAEAGIVPRGTKLRAKLVADEEVTEAIDEVVEEKRGDESQVIESLKFDISLVKDGKEIEPDGPVSISFALADAAANAEVNVYHILEDEDTKELVEAEVLEAEKTETHEEAEETAEEGKTSLLVETVTGSFSYYVVEFTVGEYRYVLDGDSSVKLSEVLGELKIQGTVTAAEVSNPALFTVEKDAEGDDWTVTALAAFSSREWMKVTIDGKEYTIVVTDAVSLPVKPGKVIDLLFDKVIKFPGSGIAKWGSKKLIDTLFPQPKGVSNEDLADMLTQMMELQSEVLAGLKSLEGIVNVTQYQQILNDFNLQNGHAQYYTKLVSPELKNLEVQYPEDRELTEEEEKKLMEDRIGLLTKTIGISEADIESAAEPIDLGTSDLYDMITLDYNIQVGNQQISTDLLGVYYELMRQKYDWEHLAYEEIATFNDNVVANYLSVATIDIASLEARATLCEEKGYVTSAGALRSRVERIKQEILNVKQIYDKHTLTEQDLYRHFWKPNHEINIYTQAACREIPAENCGKASKNFSNAKGFDYENELLKSSFWMPLFAPPVMDEHYVAGLSSQLIGTEEVNHMLEGTNHQKTLQQILEEGGFDNLADADTLLLSYSDLMNKGLVLEKTSGGTSGYMQYYWDVYLKAVSLSQKASIEKNKAETLNTYQYFKKVRSVYGTDWEIHNLKSSAKLGILQKYCEHEWDKSVPGFLICCKCSSICTASEPFGDDDPSESCLHPNIQVQDVSNVIGEEGFELKCDRCHMDVILNSKAQRVHYPILVEGRKPTALADGWRSYYQCAECDVCFEDSVGLKRIEDIDAWKKGAGHLKYSGGSEEETSPAAVVTGTWNAPVSDGTWTMDANGVWHYATTAAFRSTWGYIYNPYAGAGKNAADWFYFDGAGNMLTGWQFIGGKWYYLNPTHDGTFGACQLGGVTPDGWTVDETGAWIGR